MNRQQLLNYRDTLYQQLGKLRMENGTFRASNSPEYCSTWIRDSYYCNNAYLNYNSDYYLQTCHTYLDFLHKWENEYDNKISWLIKHPVKNSEDGYRFIHPKTNFDGSEIKGLQWQFRQQDSMPYLILMMWNGYNKGLNVFRDEEDLKIMQLLVKAMESTRYWEIDYAGSWEEESSILLSNLLLSIYATEKAYEMGFDVDRDLVKLARIKAFSQFPREREGKNWDLTLLFPCILDNFLSKMDIEDIVKGCLTNINGNKHLYRYLNDEYKPFRNECDIPNGSMEWCMSNGFLSIIFSNFGDRDNSIKYIEELYEQYPNGDIPEGVNENGVRCFNEILAWSISMTIQAIDKLV